MKDKKKLILIVLIVLLVLTGVYFLLTRTGILENLQGNVKDADGNVYETIEIGEQVWLTENLKVETVSQGETWCYEEEEENCEEYGRLYNLEAAQVACPKGWALPTDTDWQNLEKFVDDSNLMAAKLKSKVGWDLEQERDTEIADKEKLQPLDEYAFSALPGGHYYDGYFYDLNIGGYWWSSTTEDHGAGWSRVMHYDSNEFFRQTFGPEHGFSVRCIKEAN
jgi:uncharacterized protein (TIGR02145 family)